MAERNEIDCPHAKTWMTPCVARDGRTACSDRTGGSDTVVCVGCGHQPRKLLLDLSERYKPARRYRQTHDPQNCADILTRLVAEYVEDRHG
jgi:hypothetical protein